MHLLNCNEYIIVSSVFANNSSDMEGYMYSKNNGGNKKYCGIKNYTTDMKYKIAENISKKSVIGHDALDVCAVVKIIAARKICIENYKKVIKYSSEEIILSDKYRIIKIIGKNLVIKYFFDCDIEIEGNILSINYHSFEDWHGERRV